MGISTEPQQSIASSTFPVARPRRLRRTGAIRELVREHRISPSDLIAPLFVCEGTDIQRPIGSMPGQYNLSVDRLVTEVATLLTTPSESRSSRPPTTWSANRR